MSEEFEAFIVGFILNLLAAIVIGMVFRVFYGLTIEETVLCVCVGLSVGTVVFLILMSIDII